MRVVYEPIADRVRERLVTDEGMPVLRIELTCHESRAHLVTVLEDLPKIATLVLLERTPEVIDDQEIELGELPEHARVGAVHLGPVEISEEDAETLLRVQDAITFLQGKGVADS